jgi:hypothetical protein
LPVVFDFEAPAVDCRKLPSGLFIPHADITPVKQDGE